MTELNKYDIKVFIGSASADIELARKVAKILTDLGVQAKLWTDTNAFTSGKTIYNNLIELCKTVDAAVFIFGNTEEIAKKDSKGNSIFVPRDNVLIEYGMFSAYLHYTRAHIIRFGGSKIASDLAGITYTDFENSKSLHVKIENWLLKNILSQKFRTPYKEYLHVLNENSLLKGKLRLHDDELLRMANKLDVDYKKLDDHINELWKIVFMYDHFSDFIKTIINHHQKEDLVQIFVDCGLITYSTYIKWEHLPLERTIENTFKKMAMDIMVGKLEPSEFNSLFDKLNKSVYECIFINVYNLQYYWDKENNIYSSYRNLGG
jgi:hypothetical protein